MPSIVHHSSTQQTIQEILANTKGQESIYEIRDKLESGRYVSMIEMYPNKIDSKNRPIKFQNEKDMSLNSATIEKELKSVTREIELLTAAMSATNFEARGGTMSDRTKLQAQMEVLEKRKHRLRYYKKLMTSALESWKLYRSERQDADELKGDKNSTEAKEILQIEAQRFDEEFRRWRSRMSSPAAIPLKVREAISNIDAESTANSMVDRMVQSMRDSTLGSKWRRIDPIVEKEKLTEEIIRWQKRWSPNSPSIVPSISDPSTSVSSRASVFSTEGESEAQDLQSSPSNMKNTLLSPLNVPSSVVSSASHSISVPTEDEVEVVIMDDLNRVADAYNSGFFLTSSAADGEESDGETESDDQIKYMLNDMLKQYKVESNKLMDQMKQQMKKPPVATTTRKETPRISEDEGVKFFMKMNVTESKHFGNGQRYQSKMMSDDPRLPTDSPNRSYEDFAAFKRDSGLMPNIATNNNFADAMNNNRDIHVVDQSLMSFADPMQSKLLKQEEPEEDNDDGDDNMIIDWSKKAERDDDDDDNVLMDDDDAPPMTTEPSLEAKKKIQFAQLLEDLQMQIDHSEKSKHRRKDHSTMKIDWEEEGSSKKSRKLIVELDDLVGIGGHGKVYKGVLTDTGEAVAVKRIPVKNGKIGKKFIKLEIDILRQMTHRNLVKYMGCKYSSKLKEYSVILEYADGGSLEQYIKKRGHLSESLVSKVVHQTLRGLEYLHSKKIIHRDLKPANILITTSGYIKITDFGVSAQLLNIESMRTSCVGTPHYSAPEVIQVLPYSFQADIWSLGCSVYEMLFGHRPYHEMNQVSAMYRMVTDEHPPIPEDNHLSKPCLEFLLACWVNDWKKRPTAKELKDHPFVARSNHSDLIVWT